MNAPRHTFTMNPQEPWSYPRRILLAVTGLSPQVLTETVYALALRTEPRWIPTEIRLITTSEGAARARLALLSDDLGWFHKLVHDYNLPRITFDADHIHIITAKNAAGLDDIRTPEDNERVADLITETVRNLTADAQSAIHVSIAGGRKTMGFYLGYALSLFGRAQDRLSHVLVSEPFESSWEFFYPTPYSRVITTRDNKLVDTRDAQIMLAEIPFVSLRHGQPENLLKGKARFSESVAAVRAALGPAELMIDMERRRIRASGKEFRLPPAELALLVLFARAAQAGKEPLAAPKKDVHDRQWGERYLAELRKVKGELADLDKTEKALKNGMDGDFFSQTKSKLHNSLEKALGAASLPYLIDDSGTRPRRFRLKLGPDAIHFAPILD